MDISVIIVNWNTKNYLLECIRSLLQFQMQYSFEIIVVDNDSKDGSASEVEKKFPQVTIVKNENNVGFAKANNQGIKIAKGRYICLVNSDVLFIEDCFEKMVQYMDEHQNIGVLGPKLLWKDQSVQWSCRKYPSLWNSFCSSIGLTFLFPSVSYFSSENMAYFKHDKVRSVDVLVGAFLFVRETALKEVGNMSEDYFMYCEEIDWCKRFSQNGWGIIFFPYVKVIHYGGGSSSIEPLRFFKEYCISNIKYWIKFHSGFTVLLYRFLMIIKYLIRIPFRVIMHSVNRSNTSKEKLKTALTGLSIFLNFPTTNNKLYGCTDK